MARNKQRRGVTRWAGLAVVGLMALTTAVVWGATAASAHHATSTITATCAPDGRSAIEVKLGVYNSQGVSQPMQLKNVVSTGFVTPPGAQSGKYVAGGNEPGKWTYFTFDLPITNTGKIAYAFDARWDNDVTYNDNKAETTLPTNCAPPPPAEGGFSVTKHVSGETAGQVPGSSFTVDYACSNDVTGDLTVVDGATGTVGHLPVGATCTLTERAAPATTDTSYTYGSPVFDPAGPVTIVEDQTVAVNLDNPITRVTGGFSVTKALSGATGGYVPGSTFPVTYTCSNNTSGSLDLAAGSTQSVSGLTIGTTCTLSEGARPGTSGPGYTYGTEVFSPSNQITISTPATVAVVLTNPLDKRTGGFSVTKALSGEAAGYVAGSTFTVNYSCTDGTAGSLMLAANETKAVTDVLAGSSCTLTEDTPPATSGPSYAYGTPVFAPSDVVAVGAGANVQVTLTNPISRVVGSLTVTKSISGATDGYVAGSTFGFDVDCDGTAHDTTVSLVAGQTKTVGGIPLGATCVVTETSVPAPVSGYRYDPPALTPVGGSVVVSASAAPVAVNFDNPLVWLSVPTAKIVGDCTTSSAVVSLANKGGGEVVFAVFVDGQQFGPTHTVATSEKVLVPLTEDVPADIKVYAGDQELVASAVVTNDCQKPKVESIAANCAEGGALVTLSNNGVSPVDLTVFKNGTEVDTVSVGSTPASVLVPMHEDETVLIEVKDGAKVLSTQELTLNCQGPVVEDMQVVCADNGVVVTLANEGVNPVDLTVFKNGTEVKTVTVGAVPVDVLVPMDEGETATIEVRDSDKVLDSQDFTLDCQKPIVDSIGTRCADGGVAVTVSNDGENPVDLTVFKNGTEVETVTVGSTPITVLVPMDEGETATIEVTDGDTVLGSQEVTLDCQNPQVGSIVADCVEGGAVVTLTNDGESPVELTVTKNGEVVETVSVGADPVTVLVPMDEDETATIDVLDGTKVLDSQEITLDCQEPPTTTTNAPPTTSTSPSPTAGPSSTIPTQVLGKTQARGSLPVTGASIAGAVAFGMALLLAGAVLVGITRRRSN